MVVEQEANAKTCASLVLRLKAQPAEWKEAAAERGPVRGFQDFMKYPFARLLKGFQFTADVVRSRVQCANDLPPSNKNEFDACPMRHQAGIFEAVVGAQDPCAPARQPTKYNDTVALKFGREVIRQRELVAPASLPAVLARDDSDENRQQGCWRYPE